MGVVSRLCQPSTLRMLIWPEASSAQNNMAAVSADGSTVCVLILRLNSASLRRQSAALAPAVALNKITTNTAEIAAISMYAPA
jgi:hypothetical protein